MKVLTIANRKGGAGKSTCAAHLSVEAMKAGLKVVLIDMDPQKTLEGWWQSREQEEPYLVEASATDLSDVIDILSSKNFDLCIIDTPGDASLNAYSGIKISDLVLIPSKPTAPDLSAIGRTISIVEENEKPFVFVISQGQVRTKSVLQAASVLSNFGAVAPSQISHRLQYATAMGTGGSASDVDKQAAEELEKVWEFVYNKLFLSAKLIKKKMVASL